MTSLICGNDMIDLTEQKVCDSQLAKELDDYDDSSIPLMVGTFEQAIAAVRGFTLVRQFVDHVNLFNHPVKGTTIDGLNATNLIIRGLYRDWKSFVSNNEVYNWLCPINDIIMTVRDYERGSSVAGHYKDVDISTDNIHNIFIRSCYDGDELIAKWLYSFNDIDANYEKVFNLVCNNGHENIARWLYDTGKVVINPRGTWVLYHACKNGHFDIARWLYTLDETGITVRIKLVHHWACEDDRLEIAKFLHSLYGLNNDAMNGLTFRSACWKGNLDIAKWVYSLGGFDIHENNDRIFYYACIHGYESIARWIYSLGGVNIHIRKDRLLYEVSNRGLNSIKSWLDSIVDIGS